MKCECVECFYCRHLLHGEAHEHDHFPTPLRHGGSATVPICERCHDYKDRIGLRDWPPGAAFEALQSIFAKCSPFERLVFAKFFTIAVDAMAEKLDFEQLPPP